MVGIIASKVCSKCGKEFPLDALHFYRNRQSQDGYRPDCKMCTVKRYKQHYEATKHEQRAKKREHYAKNREIYHSRDKARYEHERDQRIANADKWHKQNSEKFKAIKRRYYERNRDKWRTYKINRRALEISASGKIESDEIIRLYGMQKGKCWWCGKRIKGTYHIDHRIPLSRGGSNLTENLVISCPHCNKSKGNKMPWEWSGRLL